MNLFGKPQEHLVRARCSVCHNQGETVDLSEIGAYICKRCIVRGLLYAADEAVKHCWDSEQAKARYRPPPPPPSMPLPRYPSTKN